MAPYAVKAGGSSNVPRRKDPTYYGDRVITLCGTCSSKMKWSAYDEIFFCSRCGYNIDLLTPQEEVTASEKTTPVKLLDLEVKYVTTDNKTMEQQLETSSTPSFPKPMKAGTTKALYKDSMSRKVKPREPTSDFDSAMAVEDRLNEKMGLVLRQNIQRRQSNDIL